MKRLVIVGTTELADLVHHLAAHECGYAPCAFAVEAAHRAADEKFGLPVVNFEEVEDRFPPETADLFVAVGYSDGNRARQRLIAEASARGYSLPALVSRNAVSAADRIGANAAVFHGAVVQPFTEIGAGTIVRPGAIVSHHGRIGAACYIASGVVMGGLCTLGDRVFLGLGARLRDGISICDDATVAMGALVTKSIREPGLYAGSPARKAGASARLTRRS